MKEKLVLSYIECNYEVEKKFDTLKEIFNYIEFYNATHFQQLEEFVVEKEIE